MRILEPKRSELCCKPNTPKPPPSTGWGRMILVVSTGRAVFAC
jgi:hypothetical protein